MHKSIYNQCAHGKSLGAGRVKYQVQKYIWYSRSRDSLGRIMRATHYMSPSHFDLHTWNRVVYTVSRANKIANKCSRSCILVLF